MRVTSDIELLASAAFTGTTADDDLLDDVDIRDYGEVTILARVAANSGTAWSSTNSWDIVCKTSNDGSTYTDMDEVGVIEEIPADGKLITFAGAHASDTFYRFRVQSEHRYLRVGTAKTGSPAALTAELSVVGGSARHKS